MPQESSDAGSLEETSSRFVAWICFLQATTEQGGVKVPGHEDNKCCDVKILSIPQKEGD